MDFISWQSGITLGIALLGAALGVINTWKALSRDRLRVRVTPQNYCFRDDREMTEGICIEVVNLSVVPITVTQVGFRISKKKLLIIRPGYFNDHELPCRLEPRASVTVSAAPGTPKPEDLATVKQAYAKTACGLFFHGTSDALKGRIKDAKVARGG